VFDSAGGSMDLKLFGKDMFISGSQLNSSDPSIADWCFIPVLKHEYGP
jgi:hypothetical protein